MYFLNDKIEKIKPITNIAIQKIIVALQPKCFDISAIPYIEPAAPIYVQALQNPPMVEALPLLANLPGTHEIRRKLHECIQAQVITAKNRQIIPLH